MPTSEIRDRNCFDNTQVLGHNALYIMVGAWLFFVDNGTAEEEVTIREDRLYFYPLAGMFCFSIFVDTFS